MKVIPKLNLNQNPQNCEEGSLMFAKNMKLDPDGSLVSDFGYENIEFFKDKNIVGHIVGLDNIIYIFTCTNKISKIYEYNELTKSSNEIKCAWSYSGGEIDGTVTTNISGEKILSIAEYIDSTEILIPLKHINLSYCSENDDESIYTQAPKVPMCNLTLKDTYAKTIPNGVYVFYIRYKIRTDVYTNWYLCSNPIFGGTSTKINTLQGGLCYINTNTDSAKSFIFNISFINEEAKKLYKSFQLGFVLAHDDSTNARSWKEFDINTEEIYFDYENVEEVDIDEIMASTYEIYNVRNITSFKNKLYISNYIESNLNNPLESELRDFSIGYTHTDSEGKGDYDYHNLSIYLIPLKYNKLKGYYDETKSGKSINTIFSKDMFDFNISNFYKGNTVEKEAIATFSGKWQSKNDPDMFTIYNIMNTAENNAIFGKTEDRYYDEGRLGVVEYGKYKDGDKWWLYDRDSKNPHQWDALGFTFIYGSIKDDDKKYTDARNGVAPFNKNTKNWNVQNNVQVSGNYWFCRDKGFTDEGKAFISENIKKEIQSRNRFIYCYLQFYSGTNVYNVDITTSMLKNTFIGDTNDKDYGIENANTEYIDSTIKNKIKDRIFSEIYQTAVGVDDDGNIILRLDNNTNDIIKPTVANIVFKAITFDVEENEIINKDTEILINYTVNAKITEWKCICNFNIKRDIIDEGIKYTDITQSSTLMPFSKYKLYVHGIDDHHIITNGTYIADITTDAIKSNIDKITLMYSIDGLVKSNKYKGFFFSIVNIGNYVAECFNYRKVNNNNIVNCLELDCLLYNLNDNIIIKDSQGNIITDSAKYYSSGSSDFIFAFGNCGFISWTDDKDYSNIKLYVIITRNTNTEKNYNLIKCSEYYPLEETGTTISVDNGFYGSYLCRIKKPDFDLSSVCYVSGQDVYNIKRDNILSLNEFKGYIQIQNSILYIIHSNFNLNYLSLTEDVNDKIFSVDTATSGIKQVAKVINSATLSYIYELKSMYKDYRNKIFKEIEDDKKIKFDNTIRVSNVLSDETINNSVFKFVASDYYNVPTDRGIIVKLFSIGNNIFVHTKGSLYKFDASQTLVSNDADISLKESEPFNNGLTQICDSQYGYAGIDNKYSGCITFDTYVFYDKQNNHLFGYSGQSQLGQIDNDIFNIIKYYNPEDCRIIHDEKNTRLLINFVIEDDKEITVSFNYKTKNFISLHDVTLNKAFNSRNICYSYNTTLCSLFDEADAIDDNIYGGATIESYLTDAPDEGTYKDCKHSVSVVLFPDNTQRCSLDSVQYVADINKTNMFANTNKTKTVLDFSRNTKINPVKEFFVTTDECQSTHVTTTVDDTVRPNSLMDYKGFKYNMGFWTSNYFRNNLNTNNIYKYPNQPGVDIVIKDNSKVTRTPNTDNASLVYGRYFILTFGFINDKQIKFENVLVNNQTY